MSVMYEIFRQDGASLRHGFGRIVDVTSVNMTIEDDKTKDRLIANMREIKLQPLAA